ncbi:hypothetical protein IFR05_014911 [Cadophora sp. M221]|nr:hypothetical protein IFR05_014911 [Cadophora sp. M221]
MIWGMIASEPRVVRVIDAVAMQTWKSSVEGQSRHPAVMHVNQESRIQGERFYKLCREKATRQVRDKEGLRELRTCSRLGGGNFIYINFEVDQFFLVPFDRIWVHKRRSNVNSMSKKLEVDRYNLGVKILEKIMRMTYESESTSDLVVDLLPLMSCHEYILRKVWCLNRLSTPLEEDIRQQDWARRLLLVLEKKAYQIDSKIQYEELDVKVQWE